MDGVSSTPNNPAQSTPRKRGRPQAQFRSADGSKIIGLVRQASGRWRISATGERFFEPDERLAIARFEAVTAKLRGEDIVKLPLPPQPTFEAAVAAAKEAGSTRLGMKIRGYQPPEYSVIVGSSGFYAAVREMLINDAKDLSIKTGVEWVGRGADLPEPTPSPTLQELIDTYAAKPGITSEEVSRCKRFWTDFSACVDIKTIREMTHEHVAKYEKLLAESKLKSKSIKHRYTRIKTVIAFGMKRGKNPDDCQRALNVLKMLESPEADALDPNPISPADFWAIHAEALKAGDEVFAALMLFALNAALYPSEVGVVKWSDVDLKRGEFSSKRHKTKVPRVSMLWPETVTALKKLPKDRDTVFNTIRQHYTRTSVFREWKQYRQAAKKPGALFNQIRDAAFTIACRTDLNQARVLAGHRLPGSVDHYVRRAPQFVADVCLAIQAEFAPLRKPLKVKRIPKPQTQPIVAEQ